MYKASDFWKPFYIISYLYITYRRYGNRVKIIAIINICAYVTN